LWRLRLLTGALDPGALDPGALDPGAADAWASACLRRSSLASWVLLRALCTRPGFVAFARVYGYFRWADDIVDAPGRDPAAVAAFVASQRALVAGQRPPQAPPEVALRLALADATLLPIVTGMWEALAFDAARGPAPLPHEALDRQVAHVGDAYLAAMWACSGAAGAPPPGLAALSRAATLTHVLRDLEIDLALGYVNLPPGVPAADTGAVATWALRRCDDADARFAAGARVLATVRPWRTRWLVGVFAWRYRRILERLRRQFGERLVREA
jgi:phytoene/squalene synthetase